MRDRHDDAVRRLAEACRRGDVAALRAVLAPGVVAVCDGGGTVPAPTVPVDGAEDVAGVVVARLCGRPGIELTVEPVNGRGGLVLRRAGRAVAVVGVGSSGAGVVVLWIVLNPAKLRGWNRP